MARILCLHGSGSSAEILKSQLANLISLLPESFSFDFIDAPMKCSGAPELKGIYPGPYFQFFESYSDVEIQNAVEFVEDIVQEDGQYDCVLGFSQGASVAASLIAGQQSHGSFEDTLFKIAIFICAALIPPQKATASELANTMGMLGQIYIPTVHVIGRKDPCEAQSLRLVMSCTRSTAQVLLNDGGHDVPRDAFNTTQIAAAIERALRIGL